jgi:hypothetical protein
LDAFKFTTDRFRQGFNRHRFGKTWDALDEYVPAGQKRDN